MPHVALISGQWSVHIFAKRKYIEIYEVNYIERPKVLYRISHSEIYRVRSTFQWSVLSGQWSVVSGQWSAVSGQWSVHIFALRKCEIPL